jgi:hypothetical protein
MFTDVMLPELAMVDTRCVVDPVVPVVIVPVPAAVMVGSGEE